MLDTYMDKLHIRRLGQTANETRYSVADGAVLGLYSWGVSQGDLAVLSFCCQSSLSLNLDKELCCRECSIRYPHALSQRGVINLGSADIPSDWLEPHFEALEVHVVSYDLTLLFRAELVSPGTIS